MRHYVAMVCDECGDEMRATEVEYEYPEFDEDDELAFRLFHAWESELANAIQELVPEEYGAVWIERVHREEFRFHGIW